MIDGHASWARAHLDLSREDLVTLMSRNRYGIHGMVGEHFGIAVAELVQAGCVTFVHDVGGPVEIVGPHSSLLYTSEPDGVEKEQVWFSCTWAHPSTERC